MKKTIAFGVALLFGTIAYAQTNTAKVAWDYLDSDLTTFSITEFQVEYDNGSWISVGIPTETTPITGGKTYFTPLVITNGPHTVMVRACNADLCSDGFGPLAFIKPGQVKNLKLTGGK